MMIHTDSDRQKYQNSNEKCNNNNNNLCRLIYSRSRKCPQQPKIDGQRSIERACCDDLSNEKSKYVISARAVAS